MALIQINMMSETLMRRVNVTAVIPGDSFSLGKKTQDCQPYKTLYLLHGVMDNQNDWVTRTNIRELAEEKHLTVIMPAGDNSFYVDREVSHEYYGEYIGRELVEVTRRMFPLSYEKNDTFIAGLSMGGYGALRNGLKYYETFGYVAGLSTANFAEKETWDKSGVYFFQKKDFVESRFGKVEDLPESDKDILWLAKMIAEDLDARPKLMLTCGLSDFLLEDCRRLKNELVSINYKIKYYERAGGHDWNFWNNAILRVIKWLPLNS